MEAILTYTPFNIGWWTTVLLPLIIGGLLGLLVLFLQKKNVSYENRPRKNLLVLLLFFGIMLCLGVAVFSYLNIQRLYTVQVTNETIRLSEQRTIPFDAVRRVYLHQDVHSSHLSPQWMIDTTYLLVVEEKTGKTHVFSAHNYPVKEMVVGINKQLEAWKK